MAVKGMLQVELQDSVELYALQSRQIAARYSRYDYGTLRVCLGHTGESMLSCADGRHLQGEAENNA